MIVIKATANISSVADALIRTRLRKRDLVAVYRRLRTPMWLDQRRHWKAEEGPRGPWAPLAPSTLARYAREGRRRNIRILRRLPDAGKMVVTSKSLTLKSPVRWSLAHFDGPTRVGRGALVPMRQYWWISKTLVSDARAEFRRALIRRWRGQRYP